MTDSETYISYFKQDKLYKAVVNADLIRRGKVSWKDYIPHKSFINLLGNCCKAMLGQTGKSCWITGNYGTGKSHAIFTVKGLLEASENEFNEYTAENKGFFSADLLRQMEAVRSRRILFVIGGNPGTIETDQDLICMVQEDIRAALKEKGYDDSLCGNSLRSDILDWLQDENRRRLLESVLRKDEYMADFGGSIENVLYSLQSEDPEIYIPAVSKIRGICQQERIAVFTSTIDSLKRWIHEVIETFKLDALMLLWDEFTEYLVKHSQSLVGFQGLAELSSVSPFYMTIIAHMNADGVIENKTNKKKLMDRFSHPIEIKLPEKVAFHLMSKAMNIRPEKKQDWHDIVLDELSKSCRKAVSEILKSESHLNNSDEGGLTDTELYSILPIHPYSALMLKHLAVLYQSNQRSMFEFIALDDKKCGFRWFIENYGPYEREPMLTVDMLWSFFYERSAADLDRSVRSILDGFSRYREVVLGCSSPEKAEKIFKSVLLMEAVSIKINNVSQVLRPCVENIKLALCHDCSDISENEVDCIVNELVNKHILSQIPVRGGSFRLSIATVSDNDKIEKAAAEKQAAFKTIDLISAAELGLKLPVALKRRFDGDSSYVLCHENFTKAFNELKRQDAGSSFKIVQIFAKDLEGAAKVQNLLSDAVRYVCENNLNHIIFADFTKNTLNTESYKQYCTLKALAESCAKSDKDKSACYDDDAKKELKKWQEEVERGSCNLIYLGNNGVCRVNPIGRDSLLKELRKIARSVYPYGLEVFEELRLTDALFLDKRIFKTGCKLGISLNFKGTGAFGSNDRKLKEALAEIFNREEGWENRSFSNICCTAIAQMRRKVKAFVADSFDSEGRVSVKSIIAQIQESPYGFYMCGLGAFVLGFILSEYSDSKYLWSNGRSSASMNEDQLAVAVDESMKSILNPGLRTQEHFIAVMPLEHRRFIDLSREVFNFGSIDSLENLSNILKPKMIGLEFPLWAAEDLIASKAMQFKSSAKQLKEVIKSYCSFVRASGDNLSECAGSIGKLAISLGDSLQSDLKLLFTKNALRQAMALYVSRCFKQLEVLADKIGASNRMLDDIKKRFSRDAAWVWQKETVDAQIEETILEYSIIEASNELLPEKGVSFKDCMQGWINCGAAFKVSASFCRGRIDDNLYAFLNMLSNLLNVRSLQSRTEKEKFFNLVKSFREGALDFSMLRDGGRTVFYAQVLKQAGFSSEDIESLSQEIEEVFGRIEKEAIKQPADSYISSIRSKFEALRLSRSADKCLKLWQEKSLSDSPKQWSEAHRMPIILVAEAVGLQKELAAKYFAQLNAVKAGSRSAEFEAIISFIDDNARFFEALKDEALCSRAFAEFFIPEQYSRMLTVEQVRDALAQNIGSAFGWADSRLSDAQRIIKMMVEKHYEREGLETVRKHLSSMSADEMLKWLSDAVMRDKNLGMQIYLSLLTNK